MKIYRLQGKEKVILGLWFSALDVSKSPGDKHTEPQPLLLGILTSRLGSEQDIRIKS